MSQPADILVHPTTGERVQTWTGFSWPCFFCGCFWYAAKGLWGMGILAFLLALVSYGLAWLFFPFFANQQYRDSLLKQGYRPLGSAEAMASESSTPSDELGKLAQLRASGALTAEEFERAKGRVLDAGGFSR